jgi:hypothetical protein
MKKEPQPDAVTTDMATLHDFRDGRGEVPAHKHTNPDGSEGGWVSDDSEVSADSTISRDSTVRGSTVRCSTVRDGSIVRDSSVSGASTVSRSIVSCSTVRDSSVSDGSTVRYSTVSDGSTVSGGSTVSDSTVRDGNTVRDGTVRYSTVSGYSIVSDGQIIVRNEVIDPTTLPVIPQIDAAILAAIGDNPPRALNMSTWHTCATTHCRAGWAITLAGEAGKALEQKYDSETAGALIYAASRPGVPIPDFFASNEDAMASIKADAARAS